MMQQMMWLLDMYKCIFFHWLRVCWCQIHQQAECISCIFLLLDYLTHVSNYSCGSTILTCLYCALVHKIDFNQDYIRHFMLLLQCWAWEWIKCISPSIDPLTSEDIAAWIGFPLTKGIFLSTQLLSQMKLRIVVKFYFVYNTYIVYIRWYRAPLQRQHPPTCTMSLIRKTLDHLWPKHVLNEIKATYNLKNIFCLILMTIFAVLVDSLQKGRCCSFNNCWCFFY